VAQIIALAYPVLAGREGEARDLVSQVKDRQKEYRKSVKERRVTKEAWVSPAAPWQQYTNCPNRSERC